MIKRLLTIKPERRIKLDEIKSHPFYQMGLKILKKREVVLDTKILTNKTIDKMVKIGYNLPEIKATLKNHETNHVSTAFQLLYNKVKSIDYQKNLNEKSIIFFLKLAKTDKDTIELKRYQNELCDTDNEIEDYNLNLE